MGDDIKHYVQSCDVCQKRKRTMKTEPLHPIKVGRPYDRIGMDIVGPLPKTARGNQYIVVATEYLTKWPEARALPDAKAISVATFFYEDIICRHGCPRELLTDQGTHFVNEMVEAMCTRLGVKHRLSTAYHPQTNGLVERFNRTLCEILAKYCDEYQQEWDIFIPSALFAYRTMRQNTTRYEPFYLTYGRDAILPIELVMSEGIVDTSDFEAMYFKRLNQLIGPLDESRRNAQRNIQISQQRQMRQHDKRIVQHNYRIVDKVLLKNFRIKKLDPKWTGPYFIHDIKANGTFKLRTLEGKVRKKQVHADQIIPYVERKENDGTIGSIATTAENLS